MENRIRDGTKDLCVLTAPITLLCEWKKFLSSCLPSAHAVFLRVFYGKGENRDGPWGIECSEVMKILAAAWLMLSSLLYSLQLSSGSFPRPLTREEEQYYLDLAAKGDLDARNVLVERNLRLVAHIMNKG